LCAVLKVGKDFIDEGWNVFMYVQRSMLQRTKGFFKRMSW
jgi:hypothetical protein